MTSPMDAHLPPCDAGLTPQVDPADVEALVGLVSDACDPDLALAASDRRESLYRGLAELIDADAWWGGTVYSAPHRPTDTTFIHSHKGGWRGDAEWMRAAAVAQDHRLTKDLNAYSIDRLDEGRTMTYHRSEAIADDEFYASGVGRAWLAVGFDHCLFSLHPLGDGYHSDIAFHRRVGRPPFTERDRTVVHLVWQNVDWLHRREIDVPAAPRLVELTLRERQVLLLMLGGATRNMVAATLGISEHTAGDYVKAIYRKLGVNRFAELLTKFMPQKDSSSAR